MSFLFLQSISIMITYQKLAKIASKFISKSKVMKYGFNLSPMYRRTSAKVVFISDDFLKIKQELVDINISDGSATFTDRDISEHSVEENQLKKYHESMLENLKNFLNPNNSSNSFYDNCLSYKNYLETLDYSTITFPLTKPWEKYCEDNSITYLHPLQIP